MTTHTQKIGPYTVLDEIGRGGMGIVYRAVQPSLNRVVALKVLPQEYENDRENVYRFQQEAQTAAKLSHSNIVKVWEASIYEAPYYIAMEYLDGGTLADRLQHGPLPAAEAVRITQCLCSALDHAHAHGIVHRDVKPENIMFDATGRPVIMDFGIAKAAGRTAVTIDGTRMGTPDYMSPEQAKGLALTNVSDLFSLAMVLYEMLAGRPPFSNADPLATMRQVIDQPIPPLRRVNPDVPSVLEAVVMKALSKRSESRYQSGQAFAEALRQPGPRTTGPTAKNRRLLLATLLGVILVSLAIVAISLIGGSVISDPPPPIIVPKLIDMSEAQAKEVAKNNWDLKTIKESSEKPVGTIIKQEPAAGSPGSKGATITITVSKGPAPPKPPEPPKMVDVPNFIGMTWARADELASKSNIEMIKGASKESSIPKGLICSQDQSAGAKVKQGTPIRVAISLGSEPPPPPPVRVPPLIGKSEAAARAVTRQSQLTPVVKYESHEPPGVVYNTQPAQGVAVAKGSRVMLYIGKASPVLICPDCKRSFKSKALLDSHKKNDHTCPYCDQYFTDPAYLENKHKQSCIPQETETRIHRDPVMSPN